MSENEMAVDNPRSSGSTRAATDVELEMALLAVLASRDMGEATEAVRLDSLSPIDKEVLLQLIRGKLGLNDSTAAMTEHEELSSDDLSASAEAALGSTSNPTEAS